MTRQLPGPINSVEMYLAALLEEIRGLREDLARDRSGGGIVVSMGERPDPLPADLAALTVNELKILADERGIAVPGSILKADLIALLRDEAG